MTVVNRITISSNRMSLILPSWKGRYIAVHEKPQNGKDHRSDFLSALVSLFPEWVHFQVPSRKITQKRLQFALLYEYAKNIFCLAGYKMLGMYSKLSRKNGTSYSERKDVKCCPPYHCGLQKTPEIHNGISVNWNNYMYYPTDQNLIRQRGRSLCQLRWLISLF